MELQVVILRATKGFSPSINSWSTTLSFLWSSCEHSLHFPKATHLSHLLTVSFVETGRRHAWWSNSQAGRPPLHRYTSWWPCWESDGQGELLGHGTVPDIPPPWVPSAEFERRSGTCCLPLLVVFGWPLQFESTRVVLNTAIATSCSEAHLTSSDPSSGPHTVNKLL